MSVSFSDQTPAVRYMIRHGGEAPESERKDLPFTPFFGRVPGKQFVMVSDKAIKRHPAEKAVLRAWEEQLRRLEPGSYSMSSADSKVTDENITIFRRDAFKHDSFVRVGGARYIVSVAGKLCDVDCGDRDPLHIRHFRDRDPLRLRKFRRMQDSFTVAGKQYQPSYELQNWPVAKELYLSRLIVEIFDGKPFVNMLTEPVRIAPDISGAPVKYGPHVRAYGLFERHHHGNREKPFLPVALPVPGHIREIVLLSKEYVFSRLDIECHRVMLDIVVGDDFVDIAPCWCDLAHEVVSADDFVSAVERHIAVSDHSSRSLVKRRLIDLLDLGDGSAKGIGRFLDFAEACFFETNLEAKKSREGLTRALRDLDEKSAFKLVCDFVGFDPPPVVRPRDNEKVLRELAELGPPDFGASLSKAEAEKLFEHDDFEGVPPRRGNVVETELARAVQKLKRDAVSSDDGDLQPFWVGLFWRDYPIKPKFSKVARNVTRSMMALRIRSIPTDDVITRVLTRYPAAADLMRRWRTVFDRSFPGWHETGRFNDIHVERSYVETGVHDVQEYFQKRGSRLESLVDVANAFGAVEKSLWWGRNEIRDHRCHHIDDAVSTLALAVVLPSFGAVEIDKHIFTLQHVDADGVPILEDRTCDTWSDFGTSVESPSYHTWPSLGTFFLRRHVLAENYDVAGAVIADMAWQGHKRAFIKAVGTKNGTWIVNIDGVKTIAEGTRLLRSMLPIVRGYDRDMQVVVQEYVEFSGEQRFFVLNGRVFASVCSDRNFSVLDVRPGKRLDDRIATLMPPKTEAGPHDRGKTGNRTDRSLAAAFARKARQVASVLAKEGVEDYVVDIGLCDRGVAVVEINELCLSGPYCLDRAIYARAYRRLQDRLARDVRTEVLSKSVALLTDKSDDPLLRDGLQRFVLPEPDLFSRLKRRWRNSSYGSNAVALSAAGRLLLERRADQMRGTE